MSDKAKEFRDKLKEESRYRVNDTFMTIEESRKRVAETRKIIDEEYPQIMKECKEALVNIERKAKQKKDEPKKATYRLYIKDKSYGNAQIYNSMEELKDRLQNIKGDYIIIRKTDQGDEIITYEGEER